MRKFLSMIACAVFSFCMTACSDDEEGIRIYEVAVQLMYPSDSELSAIEGIEVRMTNEDGTAITAQTDATGNALFELTEGIYQVTATDRRALEGYTYTFNGQQSNIVVAGNTYVEGMTVNLSLVAAKAGQIILKEVYVGGCPKDDGSGNYQFDKYVVIYNNSEVEANIKNFCISNAGPYNANAGINNYVDGRLVYDNEDYTPAHAYLFYMQHNLVLAPYTSATIVLCGAINHTNTYTNSVDLSHADYVCYDEEDFWNTSYHPSPSADIPTSNYLLASKYCLANQNATAWSMVGPALFIFSTGDNDPNEWAQNTGNRYYMPGKENNAVYAGAKIPNEWILDAIDIWGADYVDTSLPRFTASLEAGRAIMTNKQGYSIYRNVDKEATEALAENEGKLVYGYSLGTTDYQGATSTDPSGIDAEASIKNGARIVYQDTNNSTNDFHQRAKASLKN